MLASFGLIVPAAPCHQARTIDEAVVVISLRTPRCMQRVGLQNDLPVAHDEGIRTEGPLVADVPGDERHVTLDAQTAEREAADAWGRKRGDETFEERADFAPAAIGSVLGEDAGVL